MNRALATLVFLLLVWSSAAPETPQSLPAQGAVGLKELLAAASSDPKAQSQEAQQLQLLARQIPEDSATWPIVTFLLGEVHRLRHESREAQDAYRSLVEWAASSGGDWGGSGLAGVALWRCLQLQDSDSSRDPAEISRLLKAADRLLNSRLIQQMFKTDVLTSLPRLQEAILRQLTAVAWKAQQKEEAQRLFIEYLTVATDATLTPAETELKNQIIASRTVSSERLLLYRAKRLHELGKFDDASVLFNEVQKGSDVQARVEANFYLARIQREIKAGPRPEISQLLGSVIEESTDPDVAQSALLYRARMFLREGSGQDTPRALQDLNTIVQKYPQGLYADDAQFELARYYLETGNLEEALKDFEQLRKFNGPNDWINLAFFQPAMALYGRGTPEDLEAASSLLIGLEKQEPSGPLHLANLFWLGRIAEDRKQEDLSRTYFLRVITESPFDYYALRARLHLNSGGQASGRLWLDSKSSEEMRKEYRASKVETRWIGDSPYHLRLHAALESGLYSTTLDADRKLRDLFPSRRVEDLTLEELDHSGLLPAISLLLALRQDAIAAKDILPTPQNRLQIAAAVGNAAQDWPLAMSLAISRDESQQNRFAAQRDNCYLSTAYPPVFRDAILSAAARRKVPPELLYAIMRRESFFYPAALSKYAALGLFQFLPSTFEELNRRWGMLQQNNDISRQAFLLNPESSIDLGARWFQEELLNRENNDVVLAIMEHHAGYPAVRSWKAGWKSVKRDGDLEYEIETARFAATRLFVREVVTDLLIMRGSAVFGGS